ncbi:unnamed protein product [Cyclocybe aegerita]|uniref:ADP/ATP carrier receptor n=1 Tax=Cyclocybe aegerita TaxID=1973307 RepID=A0A8S0WRL5_CYCAE|nr:unnamed protein product [Cyclocybe aegerita]
MAPTDPTTAAVPAPSETLVERASTFVSTHRKVLVVAAASAAVAGGLAYAYWASTSSSSSRGQGKGGASSGGAGGAGEGRKKKKSGSKGAKKGKGGSGSSGSSKADLEAKEGPILEEVPGKAKVEDVAENYDGLSAEQIFALPIEERTKVAGHFKAKGNAAYTARQFADAAELYTRAIQVSPTPEPVFYSNRAACYVNMSPPKHDLVVADCDEALKLDPKYVKALNRRAIALEGLERYREALRDFTAATILDRFQNQTTANAVERVLKVVATKEAKETLENREPRLPSYTFISAYFAAFRRRPHPTLPPNPSQGDQTLLLALQALDAADYPHAVTLVNEALEQGVSWDEGRAEGVNLRGTFRFLTGQIPLAQADLEESLRLHPGLTQSLVKLASVHMEQGDPAKAFACFDEAEKTDPKDADVFYHRGQVLFIMNEFAAAAENYLASSSLDPPDGEGFVFSHIQLAVAQYKMGELAKSMATFRRTLKAFPGRSEGFNYYGELLLDQQRFEEAVEKFEKAIEIEKTKTPPNVLPLVNKGLALYQWKQDLGAAERCCHEALRIDPECEAAVATLAQLSLQQSNIKEAAKLFRRQCELARSEPELVNALTYAYATEAQVEFLEGYPEMARELGGIAQGMMGM